ncbi:ANTAR domain-containing protein [Streptomyces sp. NBC_01239]|uniref:ANTAR domain-containing protein n=1 Tax=Streptomyces sp. NBC_01239 TaxID=2903792 RepID=UPI0022546F1A|nr:ANTAR domain-containing protein [Streptomyces sp. NBC_01239]MCX4813727.1 ANTAR domain-containing protein [Streptomyces sp. NBC_01239]
MKALEESLPAPQRELAQALRTHFDALSVTLVRYGARVHLDKSMLSRYFSGERIPPWAFVHDLLVHSCEARGGAAPTTEVVAHLRMLHHQALTTGKSRAHLVQLLEDKLAAADAEARRAAMRENDIEARLQDALHRIAELAVRERELEALLDEERESWGAELQRCEAGFTELYAERETLALTVQRLEAELATMRERHLAAEKRCAELEQQLEEASTGEVFVPTPRNEGSDSNTPANTERRLMSVVADMTSIALERQQSLEQAEIMNGQLQVALISRVVIEQAKGLLASHWGTTPDLAFHALRAYARRNRVRLHDISHALVEGKLEPERIPPPGESAD